MSEQKTTVCLGAIVHLELLGEAEPERLLLEIVPDEQADFYAGYLGESTALARAICGHVAGEVVSYPGGQVRILEIHMAENGFQGAEENAARRKAAIEQARKEINRTNAIVFSSTIEGKWGEYDTDSIDW